MKQTTSFLLLALAILALSACTTGQASVTPLIKDTGTLELYFCPQDNCSERLAGFISAANTSIHCSFFDLDNKKIVAALEEKDRQIEVQIVVDNTNKEDFTLQNVRYDKSGGLMHNKFCIVDGKMLSTGSMNPTENDAKKNNNNLLLISSKVLAQNYEAEFQEQWEGRFRKGEKTLHRNVLLNEKTKIKNLFCPEDACAAEVKKELQKAKKSIYFMTFSFTHPSLANTLILKSQKNVTIKGIIETRQTNVLGAKYKLFISQDLNVIKDTNKYNMHHKVFIIDRKTVITGSFNPTKGGDKRNDENLLIIEDKEIAKLFVEEFERLWKGEEKGK